jgi:hypothetical protein
LVADADCKFCIFFSLLGSIIIKRWSATVQLRIAGFFFSQRR